VPNNASGILSRSSSLQCNGLIYVEIISHIKEGSSRMSFSEFLFVFWGIYETKPFPFFTSNINLSPLSLRPKAEDFTPLSTPKRKSAHSFHIVSNYNE